MFVQFTERDSSSASKANTFVESGEKNIDDTSSSSNSESENSDEYDSNEYDSESDDSERIIDRSARARHQQQIKNTANSRSEENVVKKLKFLAKNSRPVYEDYMPELSSPRSPLSDDDDDNNSNNNGRDDVETSSQQSESDVSSDDEKELEERVRKEVAKALNAKKKKRKNDDIADDSEKTKGNSKKNIDNKKKKKDDGNQKKDSRKKQAPPTSPPTKNLTNLSKGVAKKLNGQSSANFTYKQRKQLQSWVKQVLTNVTKISEAVSTPTNNNA